MRLRKKVGIGVSSGMLVLILAVVSVGYALSAHIAGTRLARVEASPNYQDGAFVNIEPPAPFELDWGYVKAQFFGEEKRVPPGPIPVVTLAESYLDGPAPEGLHVTWLGHASVLIEIDGHRVLTDPVLSERASPFQFVGPKRFHPPPLPLENLKGIDAVVISHSHYDHLDKATIRHLAGQGTEFFVPLGVGAYLEEWGVPAAQIHGLDWWETMPLGDLAIVATPARHYSGRGLFDYKETLWASWSILGPAHRVYYSGDSGYSKQFRAIGERFGPFDLNIVKVGSYGPGQSWLDIHMIPEDAVEVVRDVGGGPMLPVHWATFNLAIHDWDEPIRRAEKAAAEKGVTLLTPRPGETVDLAAPAASSRWWESVGN
ncbi:MBL fold metallo-hydrolase [Sneathiella chungangensis]|uniref:MBL fold metallo-hydrolase n=1 Tax=Sneathiella chungangensis TaxID=1418234 RepID=A0A845MF29_9PROT|nr:MBL fold metallo-hydrolase [Sneathiella chungangensis]MZR22275.1 MBL fold metallo-hydrolase [Sneathiella chungangensis]